MAAEPEGGAAEAVGRVVPTLPPGLDPANPQHLRLMLDIQAVHTQNDANEEKRYHTIMKNYTLLYTNLAASCVAKCEHLRRQMRTRDGL